MGGNKRKMKKKGRAMNAKLFPVVTDDSLSEVMKSLAGQIEGRILTDRMTRVIYATDASSYREFPMGVVIPNGTNDLKAIVRWAAEHRVSLIPRGAGTSLAGQVVGNGLAVDMRRFDRILEVDRAHHWVRVEPGCIRDILNAHLAPFGLLFGPETSTANRAVIGGMIGNNSCGMHSLIWGSTRDHVISCTAILSDGSEVVFEALSPETFHIKRRLSTLEGRIYEHLYSCLADTDVRHGIEAEYPKPEIRRRNNGYAVDLLLRSNIFTPGGPDFNMCQLVCGSEGTLCLVTEAKLNLVPPPPPIVGVVTMHFLDSIEALRATLIAREFGPTTCELFGAFHIQQALANNAVNSTNVIAQCSQWIQGTPQTVIAVEFCEATRAAVEAKAAAMVEKLESFGMGYTWPLWFGEDVEKIWTLRRALGGINNSKAGDLKACELIEDCALDVNDLPEFVRRLETMLDGAGVAYTHSAHAGDGELHTIVFLNLKTEEGQRLYRWILDNTATLVKSFKGSLSGEHGDGRMRAEFLEKMIGEANYRLCCEVKDTFDPQGILNPNKIVRAQKMDTQLRYSPARKTPDIPTYFDWSRDMGLVRSVERCSGMAECKKIKGGLMCPSYMATRDEMDSTRARANVLREFLTHSPQNNPFDHREIRDILSNCLACKGCKSECSAGVDMARLKAEFLQHWHDAHAPGLRPRVIANFAALMRLAVPVAPHFNALIRNRMIGQTIKGMLSFASERSIPEVCRVTLAQWYRRNRPAGARQLGRRVHLFCDEFTNLNDAQVGIAAVRLLEVLGYEVVLVRPGESGRALISQGFLKRANRLADKNVAFLSGMVADDAPLVGVEPSAIACFKDEYPDLVSPDLRGDARVLAGHSLMFEEFIVREMEAGRIRSDSFTDAARTILVHVHCHQKALSSSDLVIRTLSLPLNYRVREIPSSCCGMGGAFGYEKEHYAISMKIAEQVLLPTVREAGPSDVIAASGTSCRHQILDGAARQAKHTAEILYEALKP
ncbi:FAD-binding and (Fe-S)-binding domain-containing protein [Sodalis ligni]|nr:FAD-binding oxidoreductase [Sodalis ligni]